MLTAQALSTLSQASAQLVLQAQADIQYLADGQYRGRRGKQLEQIDARMESINKSFQVIHESMLLKASAYYEAGELPAMLSVVSEYGRFLEETVVPNAPRLAEFDRRDNLLRGGTWETRARLLSGVEEVKGQLDAGASYYLAVSDEEITCDEG